MSNTNEATLIGHLGADPELRYTTAGAPVCNFRVATNERYRDKQGNKQERTEWHRVVAWGKAAEVCGEYLHSGSHVMVKGALRTRKWTDRNGVVHYTTEIHAGPGDVTFLSPKAGATSTANGKDDIEQELDGLDNEPAQQNLDYGPPAMTDEDVPF